MKYLLMPMVNLLLAKVASLEIAASLLNGGTAYSVFKLPLDLINIERPCSSISKRSYVFGFSRM